MKIKRGLIPIMFFLHIVFVGFAQHIPKYPFPTPAHYAPYTIFPDKDTQAMNAATRLFYEDWKRKYIRTLRTDSSQSYISCKDYDNKAENYSEGQGYGMIIMALMAKPNDLNAQVCYDKLFNYYHHHLTRNHKRDQSILMSWRQTKNESEMEDAAPDGDMDIAYSLLLADAQWGNAGPIHYRDTALRILDNITRLLIDKNKFYIHLSDDDKDPKDDSKKYFTTRTSDFMPAHFRVFSKYTGNSIWDSLICHYYRLILELRNTRTGLVPDFITSLDKITALIPKGNILETRYDGEYYHNACRVPWRIGLDYLLNGDSSAMAFTKKLNGWVVSATSGQVTEISEGYRLNGSPMGKETSNFPVMCYVCPLAIAAMTDSTRIDWLKSLWKFIISQPISPLNEKRDKEYKFDYFNNTIKMLNMIILTGNYWEPRDSK